MAADKGKTTQLKTGKLVTDEELAQVEQSFQAQKRLSFRFGAVFFFVTLLIPFLNGTAEWWYGTPIFAGLTLNFWTTILLFHIFYWLLAYFFVKRANKLDDDIRKGNL